MARNCVAYACIIDRCVDTYNTYKRGGYLPVSAHFIPFTLNRSSNVFPVCTINLYLHNITTPAIHNPNVPPTLSSHILFLPLPLAIVGFVCSPVDNLIFYRERTVKGARATLRFQRILCLVRLRKR